MNTLENVFFDDSTGHLSFERTDCKEIEEDNFLLVLPDVNIIATIVTYYSHSRNKWAGLAMIPVNNDDLTDRAFADIIEDATEQFAPVLLTGPDRKEVGDNLKTWIYERYESA
jgi:hypothetical protein